MLHPQTSILKPATQDEEKTIHLSSNQVTLASLLPGEDGVPIVPLKVLARSPHAGVVVDKASAVVKDLLGAVGNAVPAAVDGKGVVVLHQGRLTVGPDQKGRGRVLTSLQSMMAVLYEQLMREQTAGPAPIVSVPPSWRRYAIPSSTRTTSAHHQRSLSQHVPTLPRFWRARLTRERGASDKPRDLTAGGRTKLGLTGVPCQLLAVPVLVKRGDMRAWAWATTSWTVPFKVSTRPGATSISHEAGTMV